FILNLAYSFKLKQIPIIDITVISLGFLIRVLVGGYATGVFVSRWTILLTFLLALIMAIGKRRGELIEVKLGGVTRKSLNGYSVEMLDMSFSIIASVSIVCYIMYTFSSEAITTFKDGHNLLYLSVIFLVVSILRYVQQTVIFNRTESPTKVLYKDKFLQFIIFSWSIFFLMLLYYNSLKQIFLHLLRAI
ncbi:MAG: prenyltransferase, partial [Solirubrobacteraceae bacterium]